MRVCPDCQSEYSGAERFCPLDGVRLVERTAPPPDPYVGTTLDGRYELLKLLGEGSTGRVYRAHHVLLGNVYALKIFPPDLVTSQDAVQAFRTEAARAGRAEGDHFVHIHDFGHLEDGSQYLAMDMIVGASLATTLMKAGPMNIGRALGVTKQLCVALGQAHLAEIVHGTLRPKSILLTERDGQPDFVKIIDFGVRHLLPQGALTEIEEDGAWSKGAEYMAPEQAQGEETNELTDIYGVGVLLYQMLTGRPPFVSGSAEATLKRVVYEKPLPLRLSKTASEIHPDLEEIVLQVLAKSPKARFASMAVLRRALEGISQEIIDSSAAAPVHEIGAPEPEPEPEAPPAPPMPT